MDLAIVCVRSGVVSVRDGKDIKQGHEYTLVGDGKGAKQDHEYTLVGDERAPNRAMNTPWWGMKGRQTGP